MAIMERAGVSGSRDSVGQRRGSGTVADQGELEQVRISVQAPAFEWVTEVSRLKDEASISS